jgi:putative GTP pyrophosphokinase
MTKNQIDRLGTRLKAGSHTEGDLRLLDEYRLSFREAYETVIRTIGLRGALPTGRPAKSTPSIVEKLRRESIRLCQMQDIAGCRVIVEEPVEQERFVATIVTDFSGAIVIDRRANPSHGYRAMHVIVEMSGKPIEIQVRTKLQHLWAEISEKSSDIINSAIKHGGGPDWWRNKLEEYSEWVAKHEKHEKIVVAALEAKLSADFKTISSEDAKLQLPDEAKRIIDKIQNKWNEIAVLLNEAISRLEKLREK